MTLTATQPAVTTTGDYLEEVVRYNVRALLRASHKSQNALADEIGLSSGAMSFKMTGQSGWSLKDLAITAAALGTTPASLMDDSLMKQTELLLSRMGADSKNTAVADTQPRYLVAPATGLEPVTVRLTVGCSAN